MSSAAVRVTTVTPLDFSQVAELARRIWPVCFGSIITPEQCDYMLGQRYTPSAMAEAIRAGMTYELIHGRAGVAGFGAHGPAPSPTDWKLWQVYVLPDQQGHGLGRHYIEHVASAARLHGRTRLVLTVNKQNARARALYERSGFEVSESACFNIGNGFVMDDYVMVRPVTEPTVRSAPDAS
jgi:ribosomal protein S18 acetylase RimI-like enzyme